MSLVTTCPHCATSFRVTPDQLRARAGEVRCGQCGQVFDGFQKLNALPTHAAASPPETHTTLPDSAPVSAPEAPPMPPASMEASVAEPGTSAPTAGPLIEQPLASPGPVQSEIISALGSPPKAPPVPPANMEVPVAEPVASIPTAELVIEQLAVAPEPAPSEIISASPPVVPEPPPEPATAQEIPAVDIELVRTQDLDMTAAPAQAPAAVPEPAVPPDTVQNTAPATAPERETYSYMAPPQHQPYEYVEENSPKRRSALWALAAVIAVTLLAAQALHVYRDELSARYPALKPALVLFCGYTSCTVRPLQRPEALKIEGSDLQVTDPSRPNVIQLTATLRNYSGGEVGYPALDLVLTDNREHTLVRRIFPSSEYLARADAPTASIAANAEVTVRIDIDVGNLTATGFRLNLTNDISI